MSTKAEIKVGENAQRRVGVVQTATRDKTRKVTIQYVAKHPKYGKYVRRTTKLLAHDEHNEGREGDLVDIAECRRLSSRKAWRLVRVVKRAEQA